MGRRTGLVAIIACVLIAAPAGAVPARPAGRALPARAASMVKPAGYCSALKRRAHRHRAGSRKRRRLMARYRRCRSAQHDTSTTTTVASPAPSAPAAPLNLYLPDYAPNPYGYFATQTCQPGYQSSYTAAGYWCAFTHDFTTWTTNAGVSYQYTVPIYQLFGVWSCGGVLRFSCT